MMIFVDKWKSIMHPRLPAAGDLIGCSFISHRQWIGKRVTVFPCGNCRKRIDMIGYGTGTAGIGGTHGNGV